MRRLLAGLLVLAISLSFAPSAAASRSYAGSAITITTTDDELNSDGDCSLREAVVAANTDTPVDACAAGNGADVVFVPAGLYLLTLAGAEEDAAATGDLDLTSDLELVGAGTTTTVIDGNHLDRVLEMGLLVRVTLSQLTIQHGYTPGLSGNPPGYHLGAGIYSRGPLTLDHVTVFSNTTGSGGGGLLYSDGLIVRDSTFSQNVSVYGSAGMLGSGRALIEGSTLVGNVTTNDRGAAIWNNGYMTLRNSTVSGNWAAHGGAIDGFGVLTITNSTITNNTYNGLWINPGAMAILANSIVAGNTSSDCVQSPKALSLGYNLLGATCQVTVTAPGDVYGAPLLGPLADNGGPTLTHMPLAGSQAIDAGHPGAPGSAGACFLTDQRHFVRPADGGTGTARCDIGAVEALALDLSWRIFLPLAGR